MQQLRRTGLVVPDQVPWGTHLCQFYESKEDLLEVLVPYFQQGLADGELCVWITYGPVDSEQAVSALRTVVPDLDRYLNDGQLEIIPHERWYLASDKLNIDDVLAAWCGKADTAHRRGFSGLRITGNAASLQHEHWADLMAYEAKVQEALGDQTVLALCSYPLEKCSADRFLKVLDVHDCVLVRRQGEWQCVDHRNSRKLLNLLQIKRHALASSISPLVMMDMQGRLTYVNRAAMKAWRYESEREILNRHGAEFFEDPQSMAEYMKEVLAAGSGVREQVARRSDGTTFDVEIHGSVTRDDQGRPIGLVASCMDVTARKEAETRLRESEERYRTLVENIHLGIGLIDRDHRIVATNGVLTGMIRTDRNCVGQHCYRIHEKRDAVCSHCPGVRAMQTGAPAEAETWGVTDDGHKFPVRIQAFPVRGKDGEIDGFIEVVEDITNRKRAEEELNRARQAAEAANRSKSEFLANMSHEIRTPMTAILGFTDILLESCVDEETVESARVVKRNGEHLLHLINDILDLSKIEAGKCRVALEDCSPRRIAAEVLSMMKVRADAKGLTLALDVDAKTPQAITTDPIRLRQVLVNLIGNAIKFTEIGGVRVLLRPGADGRLVWEVIDSGIGMTAEQISQLFHPFFQVDSSARRRFGGTGLGLAISKRLVEMLGGDIEVRSEPGRGSTFQFGIEIGRPADRRPRGEPGEPAARLSTAVRPLRRLDCRILMAEDGPDNQRLISFLLRKAGATVELAENGQVAVDMALEAQRDGQPFDVVLMDLQMPVMDGYEATRKLRALDYRLPIIALTAHAMIGDRQKCMDAGCDDYVSKPIDRHTLVDVLHRWTGRSDCPV